MKMLFGDLYTDTLCSTNQLSIRVTTQWNIQINLPKNEKIEPCKYISRIWIVSKKYSKKYIKNRQAKQEIIKESKRDLIKKQFLKDKFPFWSRMSSIFVKCFWHGTLGINRFQGFLFLCFRIFILCFRDFNVDCFSENLFDENLKKIRKKGPKHKFLFEHL